MDGTYLELKDSETTTFLCRKVDQLFDFCNSRSPKATRQRSPLTPEDLRAKKKQIMEILDLLKGLTFKQSNKTKVRTTDDVRGKRGRGRQGRVTGRQSITNDTPKTVEEVREILVKDSKRKTCLNRFVTTVNSIFELAKDLFGDEEKKWNR